MNGKPGKILNGNLQRAIGFAISIAALGLLLNGLSAQAQSQKSRPEERKVQHAKGTFEVKVIPQKFETEGIDRLGRMTLDKKFEGQLNATSKGEMLSFLSQAKDTGGYVAMEQVTGALQGRSGSFVLQHSGTMIKGVPQMKITLVPDSGTGELGGIAGTMTIRIENGQHFYDLEYSLPEPK